MDIVYIHDLRIDTVIGIYDWERRVRQQVRIDLEMAADVARAAASDAIGDTLDYKAVAKRVKALADDHQFQLVETFAEHIAAMVREEFGVPWVRVTAGKPGAVKGAREVGVRIERGERDR